MKAALEKYKPGFPVIETERLRLRSMNSSDRDGLFALFSDPEVLRYYNIDPLHEVSEADAMIERLRKGFEAGTVVRWGIEWKNEPGVIGTIGLHAAPDHSFAAEIGFNFVRSLWGKGLATEIIPAVVRFGIETLELERIEARVVTGNNASRRVLEKTGFHYEGLLRKKGAWRNGLHDLHYYSILKNEN